MPGPNPAPDVESPRMADIRPPPLPLPSFGQSITSGLGGDGGTAYADACGAVETVISRNLQRSAGRQDSAPGPRRWYAPLE